MQYRAYRRTYINTDGVTTDARTDIQTDRRAGRQADRYIQSGFLGHLNDAQQFALMDQLGTDLELPDNCYMYLLGDKIYPNRGNVVTQFTVQRIARKPGN